MPREDATAKFYRHIWPLMPTVLRTARFLITGPHAASEAEDLAQETMLKAFRFMDQYRAGSDAKAWLMTILRNTRIDRLRAGAKTSRDVSLDQLELEPAATEGATDDGEAMTPREILEGFSDETVIEALTSLPEEIRFTLLLVDVEGVDHVQAAEALGVPVGTIKSRAHRGRAMLRTKLAGQAVRGVS
jgi:RNA polymerase sigma-70 factor, ECF subfamily